MLEFFKGRTLVIATKHEKEKVMAPILEREFGVLCVVPENFNSDLLGTFSGEIERVDDPLTTLRKKCMMAAQLTGCDLVAGNEGSFGPHPTLFFAHANDEMVMLLDLKNHLEIVERELNTTTNFDGCEIASEQALMAFAEKVQFPSHGIILKKDKTDYSIVLKGITNYEDLIAGYNKVKDKQGRAYAETDMRAMFNPTRMANIEKATEKLAAKACSLCPHCSTPGFGITDSKRGLPCMLCGSPTQSILSHVYSCLKCGYTKDLEYPYGKKSEDPEFCDFCNP
ncbi:MAG TPA: hypothetical protein DCM62_03830 [Bacteroidales bacterium]|nr:hypothetical protein [Bacteroidales bacterium]